MPTNTEIKNNVDEFIIDQVNPQSVTRENVGNIIKSTVDYTDQEVSAAVVGVYRDAGNYDASAGTFPTTDFAGYAVQAGDVFSVSVAGTLGGVSYSVGDTFRALVDTPGQTSGNWQRFAVNTTEATENIFGTVKYASPEDVESRTGNGVVRAEDLPESEGLPYKMYVASVTQSGTSAPTVTVLVNNLGYTPTVGYVAVGSIGFAMTSLSANKTDVQISPRTISAKRPVFNWTVSGNNIFIRSFNDVNGAYENDMFVGNIITIIVYP